MVYATSALFLKLATLTAQSGFRLGTQRAAFMLEQLLVFSLFIAFFRLPQWTQLAAILSAGPWNAEPTPRGGKVGRNTRFGELKAYPVDINSFSQGSSYLSVRMTQIILKGISD